MVGVAGKSKGCATCRRRKIRCDQGRPECGQCLKSKRICGGYEKFPVFIVHTVNGVEKRKPLEETKPVSTQLEVCNRSAPRPLVSTRKQSIDPESGYPWEPESMTILHSSYLEKKQMVSWAYNTYERTNDAKNRYNHMPVIGWLKTINLAATTDAALDPALLALSARMFGVRYKDDVLVRKAAQSHTQALGALQRNLGHQDRAMKDETLAGSCLMALYELTDPEGRDPNAWLSHLGGIAVLLQARGPFRNRTLLARTSLEHCRYNLALHCIIARRSYGFETPEWTEDPWTGVEKPLEQRVIDHAMKLAEVLERTDKTGIWLQSAECINMLVQDCATSISNIEQLKLELAADPSPRRFEPLPSGRLAGADPWDDSEIQDVNRRMLRLTASGIQLRLVQAAFEVVRTARNLGYCSFVPNGEDLWMVNDDFDSIAVELPRRGSDMAKDIVADMRDTIRDGKGALIRGRLLFPLRAALRQLRYEPSCEQFVQGEYILQGLQGGRPDDALNGQKKDYFFMGRAQQKQQIAFEAMQREQTEDLRTIC